VLSAVLNWSHRGRYSSTDVGLFGIIWDGFPPDCSRIVPAYELDRLRPRMQAILAYTSLYEATTFDRRLEHFR